MNKYGPKARKTIEQTMDQFKRGKLRSGNSHKANSRNQKVASSNEEARDKGYEVPRK